MALTNDTYQVFTLGFLWARVTLATMLLRALMGGLLLFAWTPVGAQPAAVDLREYFPSSRTVILYKSTDRPYARYTFTREPAGFLPLYTQYLNQDKIGVHATWKKEYWKAGAWCTVTHAVLFLGHDLSVTEVGDWYASTPCTPNIVFGYKTLSGVPTGLIWSPPGGLTAAPVVREMQVWRQASPGTAYADMGYQAYSKTGLIEFLPTYTMPFGRDADGTWSAEAGHTYVEVVHLVMYHGSKQGENTTPVRCPVPPVAASGAYYQSYQGYNSYAIELWLAKGIGVIRESVPFIEDGAYWSVPACSGAVFSVPYKWDAFGDFP